MKRLEFKGTEETPNIILDKANNIFEIKGKSFMEDVQSYYEPIISWLETYKANPNKETRFVFEVEYINTASSKMFLDVLKELEDIHLAGYKVDIIWGFFEDDEDMESTGQEFNEMFDVNFIFKKIWLFIFKTYLVLNRTHLSEFESESLK